MFSTITKTAEKLAEMFTENTGRHILDSGDAYGRRWERNQGKTAQDFLDAPAAYWIRSDWGADYGLNLFHFLNDRLTFTDRAAAITAEFREYAGDDLYSCVTAETWAAEISGCEPRGWNSYNWEHYLDGTIQGTDFENCGQTFVLLQVHGGCDVRGGYTAPVVFETVSEYWIHDCDTISLSCENCDFWADVRGGDKFGRDGDLIEFDPSKPCPDCGGDFVADAPEPSGW